MTLTIPPGALDANTVITIDHAQNISPTSGLVAGAVFDFGPNGLEFNIPAELDIAYGAGMVVGLTEDELRIHEAIGLNWIPLLGSVDTANNIANASIDSFSIFGLKTIPDPGDPGGSANPNATLAWLQTNVFGDVCSQCHIGPGAPKGVNWSTEANTCANVGRASGEITTMNEIESGNPTASYVIWKVEGAGPNGEAIIDGQMPLFNPPLAAETIQAMKDWIAAGTPGCGDPDPGPGPDPGPDPGPGGPDTWATIQADILEVRCVLCHNNTPSAPMGLSWEADQFDRVVTNGLLSAENFNLKIIEPGNSAASYMVWKINGQGPSGESIGGVRMPASGPPFLDQTDIDRITAWIDAGAPGAGGDPGPDPDPDPDPGPGPDPSAIIPTWYGVQANILEPFCTVCHGGPSPTLGLSWEVDQYDAIVTQGRMSTEINTMQEVQPGNPDASYMYWKITNNPGIILSFMPATGIPLDQALIDVIEQWILDGAPLGVPSDADSGSSNEPTFPVGSWMYVWNESLQVCTLCHSTTPSSPRCGVDFDCPPKDVVLTADNYSGVVDDDEVEPFDLDGSKLWERVTDNDPDDRMPFGLPALTQTQLNIISNWILDGAPFCPQGEVCP